MILNRILMCLINNQCTNMVFREGSILKQTKKNSRGDYLYATIHSYLLRICSRKTNLTTQFFISHSGHSSTNTTGGVTPWFKHNDMIGQTPFPNNITSCKRTID